MPESVPSATGAIVRAPREHDNPDQLEVRLAPGPRAFLTYADGSRFVIDAETREIRGTWPAPLTLDDALVYLVGPVLGAALRLERRSVLHASVVEVNGHAVALMGEAGAGKSTLTAALVDRGFPLITEDVAALAFDAAGAPQVLRGGTRVKLWDESVVGLRGRADALPALVPSSTDWTKKYLDAAQRMTAHEATALGMVLVLVRASEVSVPTLEELAPHERLVALLRNRYAARLILADDRAADLARLAATARTVDIKRLLYPDDMGALADVVELIARRC